MKSKTNDVINTNSITDTASPFYNVVNAGTTNVLILPLEMRWKPKEDITTHELALCLPYLIRNYGVMPYEVDKTLFHFRHFDIIDHNNK